MRGGVSMKERLPYVVSKLPKDSTGYYCHMRNYPNIPVFGSIGDKSKAMAVCRTMNESLGRGRRAVIVD